MATAQKKSTRPRSLSPARPWPRRPWPWLMLAVVVALAWFWRPLQTDLVTATSYGARIACPCRFVAGRPLASCRQDFAPGMGLILLSEDEEAKSVTAWAPLLASQTATFRPGEGCALQAWKD